MEPVLLVASEAGASAETVTGVTNDEEAKDESPGSPGSRTNKTMFSGKSMANQWQISGKSVANQRQINGKINGKSMANQWQINRI